MDFMRPVSANSVDPEISVVLPCYRSADLARRSADRLARFLGEAFASYEVVVVDDGGGDFDASWPEEGPIRLLRLPVNRGKGAAVRAGMLASRGRVRVFTDVDLPFELEPILTSACFITERGFHLAIGDRTLPGSSYALDVGWRRRLASGIFSKLVGIFLTGGFFDTQCGFKAFRGDVAEGLFGVSRIDRFAFDVELLYVALLYRTDIKRIPVQLHNNETSVVRLLQDSFRMLLDVGKIRLLAWRGAYRSPALAKTVADDFAEVAASTADPTDRSRRRAQGSQYRG
ncbi:MAG: dolichyl-phosphate beta-glucosyltransferase [Acidobacteriota bacterium]|jgi:dolichyl-phosphate beta-glucosyltransferase|nr:dolichyl-phosphate beta-glucosyltransferase [Acidobacteriota bacterium]